MFFLNTFFFCFVSVNKNNTAVYSICKTHHEQRWFSCLAGCYSQRTPVQWQCWFPLERTWTPHSPPAWSRAVNTAWKRLSRGCPVSVTAVKMPTLFIRHPVRQKHTQSHAQVSSEWHMETLPLNCSQTTRYRWLFPLGLAREPLWDWLLCFSQRQKGRRDEQTPADLLRERKKKVGLVQ